MTDGDALVRAIIATPDDDTARLVFADWLDEHAQPHWAALVRAECARERLRADLSAPEAVLRFLANIESQGGCGQLVARTRWERAYPEVAARLDVEKPVRGCRRLSAKARNAGRPSFAACGLHWGADTRRGFPAAAELVNGAPFVRNFERCRDWCPPVNLTVDYAVGALPSELVARGLLNWTRGLSLPDDQPELFAAVCASPTAGTVRSLTLRAVGGAPEQVVAALAGSPHWTGLRELNIPDNGFTGDTAAALFASPLVRELTSLRLCSEGWTLETVDALLRAPLHNLRELILAFGALTDEAVERLAAAPVLGRLQYLDLSHNRVTARGATALLTSKHLPSLTVLELEQNEARGLDPAALAAAPAGGLRALSLHHCALRTADVAALARCPRLSDLMYLDLDYNGLGNGAVEALVRHLPRAPAIVYLMGNRIGAAGARALAGWTGAPGLDQLHVCRNQLTSEGVAALVGGAPLAGLRHLCVSDPTGADRAALEARFKARVEFPT